MGEKGWGGGGKGIRITNNEETLKKKGIRIRKIIRRAEKSGILEDEIWGEGIMRKRKWCL